MNTDKSHVSPAESHLGLVASTTSRCGSLLNSPGKTQPYVRIHLGNPIIYLLTVCLPQNSWILLGNQHADQSFHYTHDPELKWTLSTAHFPLPLPGRLAILPSINPFIGPLLLQVQMITPKKDGVLFSVMNFQPSLHCVCIYFALIIVVMHRVSAPDQKSVHFYLQFGALPDFSRFYYSNYHLSHVYIYIPSRIKLFLGISNLLKNSGYHVSL